MLVIRHRRAARQNEDRIAIFVGTYVRGREWSQRRLTQLYRYLYTLLQVQLHALALV